MSDHPGRGGGPGASRGRQVRRAAPHPDAGLRTSPACARSRRLTRRSLLGLLGPRAPACCARAASAPTPPAVGSAPGPAEARGRGAGRLCDAPPLAGLCSSPQPRGPNLGLPAQPIVRVRGKTGPRAGGPGRRPGRGGQRREAGPRDPCPSLLMRRRGSAPRPGAQARAVATFPVLTHPRGPVQSRGPSVRGLSLGNHCCCRPKESLKQT